MLMKLEFLNTGDILATLVIFIHPDAPSEEIRMGSFDGSYETT